MVYFVSQTLMSLVTIAGKIPWSRKWQPTPVFLLGESHGAWQVTVRGIARVGHDLVTKPPPPRSEDPLDTTHESHLSPQFVKFTQLCQTLCDPMPGSSVHGILQARI